MDIYTKENRRNKWAFVLGGDKSLWARELRLTLKSMKKERNWGTANTFWIDRDVAFFLIRQHSVKREHDKQTRRRKKIKWTNSSMYQFPVIYSGSDYISGLL